MVKGIIEAHKGKIQVQSELHKGTVFTFELPVVFPVEMEEVCIMKNKILRIVLTGMAIFTIGVFAEGSKKGVKFANPNVKISTGKAKEIMLQHAGIHLGQKVRITKIMLQKENRKYFYVIEFFTEDKKYKYNIDAGKGNVLNFSQENRKRAENKSKGTFWDIIGI